MSYGEQAINFMSNPLDPNSYYNIRKGKIQQADQNKDNSNATTTTLTRPFVSESDNKLTNNIKKIKPSLDTKPTQFPDCFNSCSTKYTTDLSEKREKNNLQAYKEFDQQDSNMVKTRVRKAPKRIICEGEEEKRALSVIKEKPTNEKTGFMSQSQQNNQITTEPAELAATVSPKTALREKFAHLLPPAHQRSLSSEHHQLIKIMQSTDAAIEYWMASKNLKCVFFQDIKRNTRDSCKMFIDLKHLEQLLYLDETLYEIKWERNKDYRKYDILVKLPEIKSRQVRKAMLRETIVAYLNMKHEDFLKAKGIRNFIDNGSWHEDFYPHNYEIPRLPLPPHPQTISAQLRCLDDSKINALKNEKVKEMFKAQKQRNNVKSFAKQQSSMQLIFAGTSAHVLEQRIIAAVKIKEAQTKRRLQMQAKQIEKEKTEVNPDKLKEVAEVLLKSYTGRNVSNMFKVKVIELLKEKTNNKYGDLALNRHLEYLLEQTGIGYLKEVVARDGTKILQISIGKYKEVMAHVQELKKKAKQESTTL